MLQAHVLERMGKLPRARSGRITLILRAGPAAAPFLGGRSSVEQPLHAHTGRRIEHADRVRVPPAADPQRAEPASYFAEIWRRCASPIAQTAVAADKLALVVPQDETPRSAQQLAPHPMRLRRATPE